MPEAGPSKEYATVILPPHIGAVFEEGKNIAYAVDRFGKLIPGIETYSVKDEEGRKAWLLENLRVFNSLPTAPMVWKSAIDDYLLDLNTARNNVFKKIPKPEEAEKFDSQVEETKELSLATMAVSASARAMEQSAGVPDAYLTFITQSSQEGGDLDAQDRWKTYLLHDNPEKYFLVTNEPLIKYYYQQVLKDAGIKADPTKDWHEEGDKWFTSVVELAEEAQKLRDKGKGDKDSLIYYLRDKAEKGGFDGYIKRLLKRDSEDFVLEQYGKRIDDTARWSAARIACDAFLVDKFTRWDYQLTSINDKGEHKNEKEIYKKPSGEGDPINLRPTPNWGGDPFRGVLQPSFLPRIIKNVYSGDAAQILDLVDIAFRPHDIFFDAGYGPKVAHEMANKVLHPTAVEHLKYYGRYSKALGLFFGSSRAAAVQESQMKVLGNNLKDIAELLDQVYGTIGKPLKENSGKHIVGAMLARMIYAKAWAARASIVNPNFFEDVFGPLAVDPRVGQPFRELRESLFGPTLNWKNGLIADLSSGRAGIVFRDNDYHAEDLIVKANGVLATPEEGALRKAAKAAVVISSAVVSKK